MQKTLARLLAVCGVALSVGLLTASPAMASPFRYHSTYYGDNAWGACYQRGYQGIKEGTWYDSDCQGKSYGVDLYVQVSPN
jgi:hypothetical protein